MSGMVMIQNQNQWYVEVSGQSYGPYSVAQMFAFIGEGRVIANSLISQDPTQAFAMAVGFPAFAGQLAPYTPQAAPQVARQPIAPQVSGQAVAVQPAPVTAPIASHAAKPSVFMVMAEISSGNGMRFLQALQAHGTAQRIGDSVWLLRSIEGGNAGDIDALRNALSETLTRQDRLFIIDSFNNRTAWFNIGADMDARIKELWASIPE